jgi:zinc protease
MGSRVLVAALLAVVCLEVPANAQLVDPFALPTERIVLPNGLKVLLAPDPRARLASVVVSYAAGTADDPDGLRGLAHLTEHLVANRTTHVHDALRELVTAGVSDMNAATTIDRTTYFETLPPEHLPTALWIESDRMGFASGALSDARVDAERPVVANEMRDRTRDTSLAAVGPILVRELFPPGHPYMMSLDDGDDLDHIDARDVRAFLLTWYQPSNATLAIAGAFDRDATLALVNRLFAPLPSTASPARPVLPDEPALGAWVRIHASAVDDHIRFAWRTPPLGTRDDAALDIVAAILTGPGGRLARRLTAQHLVKSVTARQVSMLRDSVFVIEATLTAGADVDQVIRETQAAVEQITLTATGQETERAQEFYRRRILEMMEPSSGRAQLLVDAEMSGEPAGAGFAWGLRLRETIGAAEVAMAAATHLIPRRRVVAVVYADRRAPVRGVLVHRESVTP